MAQSKTGVAALVLGAAMISAAGVSLIKSHEGLRYAAYPDPGTGGAPWTICWGHTKGVYKGMTATRKQCEIWLAFDLAVAGAGVKRHVKVPINQNEYDAYTSFVFNAGEGNFKSSTMLRLLNQGKHAAACNQFPRWVYADKRKLNGLVTRRTEEQALCHTPSEIIYGPIVK